MAKPLDGRHVAVLMGGLSSEREVSLSTGRGCVAALERLGARATAVDAGHDVADVLARLKPEVVLNVLHGGWGESGGVQGLLEILGLPYTHSGILASALAMDKAKAKAVMAAAGVVVPGGGLFNRFEAAKDHVMAPPYVVKPNAEGSSVGVFLVFEGANGPPQELAAPSWTFGEEVMIEPYIAGKELAVAVMGDKALAVTEIIPTTGFYDYEAKYTDGVTEHLIPAPIPVEVYEKAKEWALMAHQALGCTGLARADLRWDDSKPGTEGLVVLELNTQPGMTPLSLAPEQAKWAGISWSELMTWMVDHARRPA